MKVNALLADISKAGEGTRTHDLLITNQLLYQLSYTGLRGNIQFWLVNL